MTTYDLGDGVPLEYLVYNRAGTLTNATVTLTVTAPDGTTSTPDITNSATGTYQAQVTADQAGVWLAAWAASGTIVDATQVTWDVRDPAPPAYTDLTTVKSMLGKVTSDDRDDLIMQAIVAAARMIDRRCGRQFYAERTTSTRVFRPLGRVSWDNGNEVLRVDDFATTTGLVVETSSGIGGTWTTLTSSSYEAGPDNAAAYGRPYSQIRGPLCWITYCDKARLTARWGPPTAPEEISQANALQATRLYRRKDSPQGVLGSPEWGAVRVSRVDPDVEALIAPFVRPLIA